MIVHKIIYTKDIEANANSLIIYIVKDRFALVAGAHLCFKVITCCLILISS